MFGMQYNPTIPTLTNIMTAIFHYCSYTCTVQIIIAVFHLYIIVVRRFEYAGDPESYTSGSVATGRASLAAQVKG